jgi:hypothetical protein
MSGWITRPAARPMPATLTYRGRVATRSSASLEDVEDVKRQLDLYALWKVTRTGKLRLSVSDLLHPD